MENLKYHYLNKKIVEAKMKEKVNLDDEEGITILKDKGYNLKIEVDTTKRSVADALKLLNPDNIMPILATGIIFGVVVLTISFTFGVINALRRGDIEHGIFGKNGIILMFNGGKHETRIR